MRAFLFITLALVATSLAQATEIGIVRVWPGYRTAESFERISEYFGKEEQTGAEHILRTQPTQRAGYYFLVRLKNKGPAVATARFELQLIPPSGTEPRSFSFNSPIPGGSHAFHLGLTGSDWAASPKDEAIAWKIRILAADGTELAHTQSYLWALPGKK